MTLPLNKQTFIAATGCSNEVADRYLNILNESMKAYEINTPKRIAAFLAQICHESATLAVIQENLNYSEQGLLKVFPKYFTADLAKKYARNPRLIASRVYASRMGNGNEESQDGWKYRGRGFIQITGKNNYAAFSLDAGDDFVNNPDLLLEPNWTVISAVWFWGKNSLNTLADKDDTLSITKRINGGTHGLEDRKARYEKALKVLSK